MASHLKSMLLPNGRTELCNSVLPALLDCISDIAKSLRESQHVSQAGTTNAFGDSQLNVDIAAENLIRTALAKCPSVLTASSEEEPVERPASDGRTVDDVSPTSEKYTVAFDPLDGSSIIAPNWTVGTIIGIWDGASAIHQQPSEKQIGAVLGIYGPRTTAIIALRVPGSEPCCLEIGVGGSGTQDHQVIRSNVQLADPPFTTRYFAPANLRAAAESENYMRLITKYMEKKYTLRYSGGLVPDVVHALVKGHGVYLSPVTGASEAKLRRLYELFPIALIVECAGGKAIDPVDGEDILSRPLENCDETAGLVCGTAEEVDIAKSALLHA
ncbi:sedoheptulose-1-7-bisphosphatase [Penicillium cinerascens]|uniref:Sedoheptulose-1-7-bisphosphatase n=1 Tax=Penicillium cinerascens TaxID=70096 RepID=A0A9W9NDV8_9EURO|nr:sedoheptulose-1-7-bisphosphatase [Penicillium cinerascens]KAJ5218024.1 sedoheptulose-1-7-bisphosphatase [Penicillium cinerascens]